MSQQCLYFRSSQFLIEYNRSASHINCQLQLHTPHITTHTLPNTILLLQKYQPSVLRTRCFNYDNLPFAEEVINTELGHLFEHMLLDQLCSCKLERGWKSARCRGETSWNWEDEPVGMYHIDISAGRLTDTLLQDAFTRSAAIFSYILAETEHTPHISA